MFLTKQALNLENICEVWSQEHGEGSNI